MLLIALTTLGVLALVGFFAAWWFWESFDGTRTADELVALRTPCGIGGADFGRPSHSEGGGFQEATFSYSYENVDATWVDRNVLRRFGLHSSITVAAPIDHEVARVAAETDWGAPSLVIGDSRLVWQSPFAISDMGTTTFDVYRTSGAAPTYSVFVGCNNTAGINIGMTIGAVTTVAP